MYSSSHIGLILYNCTPDAHVPFNLWLLIKTISSNTTKWQILLILKIMLYAIPNIDIFAFLGQMPFFPDMSRWFENGTEQPKNASSDRGVFFKKIDKTRSPSWLYVMNNLIIQIKQMLKHAQYRCKFCIQVRSAWLDHKRVVCSVPYKTCSCYKSYFWWVSCLEKKIDRPLLPFSINMFTQKRSV